MQEKKLKFVCESMLNTLPFPRRVLLSHPLSSVEILFFSVYVGEPMPDQTLKDKLHSKLAQNGHEQIKILFF